MAEANRAQVTDANISRDGGIRTAKGAKLRLQLELEHTKNTVKQQPNAAQLLGNMHAAYYYGWKCIG